MEARLCTCQTDRPDGRACKTGRGVLPCTCRNRNLCKPAVISTKFEFYFWLKESLQVCQDGAAAREREREKASVACPATNAADSVVVLSTPSALQNKQRRALHSPTSPAPAPARHTQRHWHKLLSCRPPRTPPVTNRIAARSCRVRCLCLAGRAPSGSP